MRLFAILALLTALVFTGEARETGKAREGKNVPRRYVPATKFDPSRDPAQDIRAAVAEAKRTEKRILLDVGGEWCIWCHRLDTLFMQNKDLQEFLHNNFVLVKVNWSPENKNEKVLSAYPKIPGYPHFFVLDTNGKFLHSQGTGELEEGKHHDKGKVMGFLKAWAPERRAERKGKR